MLNVEDITNKILQGDTLEILKNIPSNSIDMCITSPPYYNLRDYEIDGQIGMEENYEDYLNKLKLIFNEVKRVIKPKGSCWVNIGDTYNNKNNNIKNNH